MLANESNEGETLRRIISGSLCLHKRLHHVVFVVYRVVCFCGMCDKIVRSFFWECRRWYRIRNTFAVPSLDARNTSIWLAGTLDCGIWGEDVRMLCLFNQLQQKRDAAADILAYFKYIACHTSACSCEESQGRQVIRTDASAPKNQDDPSVDLARASIMVTDIALYLNFVCPFRSSWADKLTI